MSQCVRITVKAIVGRYPLSGRRKVVCEFEVRADEIHRHAMTIRDAAFDAFREFRPRELGECQVSFSATPLNESGEPQTGVHSFGAFPPQGQRMAFMDVRERMDFLLDSWMDGVAGYEPADGQFNQRLRAWLEAG